MPLVLMKAAAVVGALVAGGVGAHAGLASNEGTTQSAQSQSIVRVYIVRSGDTLGGIAAEFCGNRYDYPSLASASGIANPNVIGVGQRIVLACGSGGSSARRVVRTASVSGSNYAAGSAVIPGTYNTYSFVGLERIWEAAGGSRYTAYHAACIAEHESSGRQWAVSPTNDWGLWQIHNGGYYMLNALPNAERAVAMSNNGRNWSQWTTAHYC